MKMLHLLFPDVNWSKRFHGSFGEDSLQVCKPSIYYHSSVSPSFRIFWRDML
jgi:hypothetical protein